jgi:hypothetical protein
MIENYIEIIGRANGNAIWQIQNNGLTSHPFYSHFLLEVMPQSIALLILVMQPRPNKTLM